MPGQVKLTGAYRSADSSSFQSSLRNTSSSVASPTPAKPPRAMLSKRHPILGTTRQTLAPPSLPNPSQKERQRTGLSAPLQSNSLDLILPPLVGQASVPEKLVGAIAPPKRNRTPSILELHPPPPPINSAASPPNTEMPPILSWEESVKFPPYQLHKKSQVNEAILHANTLEFPGNT